MKVRPRRQSKNNRAAKFHDADASASVYPHSTISKRTSSTRRSRPRLPTTCLRSWRGLTHKSGCIRCTRQTPATRSTDSRESVLLRGGESGKPPTIPRGLRFEEAQGQAHTQRLTIGQMLVALATQRCSFRLQNLVHARQARAHHRVIQRFVDQARDLLLPPAPRGFPPTLPLALFFMAASFSYPTRSADRARITAAQFSTTLTTSPLVGVRSVSQTRQHQKTISYRYASVMSLK